MGEIWAIPKQIWENDVFQVIWKNRFKERVMVPKTLGYPIGKIKFTDREMDALSKRKKFSKIKGKLKESVFATLGDKCLYCGAPADVLDHVLPIAWGGTNDTENMQPICCRCNSRKSGNLPAGRSDG